MRREYLLKEPVRRPSMKSRIVDTVVRALPHRAFRWMMESQFINFGVETTNICNANCSFCAYRFMERPKKVMPWEVYEKAVREFARAGGGSINFTPTVGDPLVDKQLVKKIRLAAGLPGITSILLYTNGILLHRFDTDEFLRCGISRLAISAYIGSREGYRRYYGRDKYKPTMENIERVARRNRELGSPVLITLHLRSSKDEHEWRETPAFRAFSEILGEENITFLDTYDAWSGRIDKDDLPKGCELDVPLPVETKKASPCFELYRRVHVLADGNVGACICTDLESEIRIGNIGEQTLEAIWKGKALADYREQWLKGDLPEVCKSCTRYTGVDDFIRGNRKRIAIDYARRRLPGLFRNGYTQGERDESAGRDLDGPNETNE
jgi:radical SAM protein with 4Fe4S-binding SPASM domain